jgi:hypothetical protein
MNNKVAAHTPGARKMRRIRVAVLAMFVVLAGAMVAWTSLCPCSTLRGFILLGQVHKEPVTDWTFVNDVPLCQLQIPTSVGPYSLNLNCMATATGDLYVGCARAPERYWCQQVKKNHPGRLRANGKVYPVVLNRVLDPVVVEQAFRARVKKLQVYGEGTPFPRPKPDAKREETWWAFHANSPATE